MFQVKKQNKTPEKEVNKMEIRNLLNAQFETLVIKMLNGLSENFSTEIGNMKVQVEKIKIKTEMKNTITDIKYTLKRISSRIDEGEERMSNLGDQVAENTQS